MSKQDGHQADVQRAPVMNVSPTKEAVDLGLVRALNERCLTILLRLARSDRKPAPPAISLNRALWCGLDSSTRQRAAGHRVLLMDINFSDAAWWRAAAESRSGEGKSNVPGYLPPRIATELMRETITVAWLLARADQGRAIILCGMAPQVARIVSSFGPSDLERLAARHHHLLRMRFDDRPSYWRMHLEVSRGSSTTDVPALEASAETHLV